MSCKDKECGTHHYACDCREAHFRKLEKVAEAANNFIRINSGLDGMNSYKLLEKAISSLHQPEGKRD